MPIRTIHLGVGGRGRWPVQRITEREDYQSVALVDVNPKNLAAARQTSGLGEGVCFEDLATAVGAVDADAVVVITPPDLHADQCMAALEAGKHILVEKPFTKDLAAARQIVDHAEARGLRIGVCQNARFAGPIVTMRRLLAEQVCGTPAFGLMTKYGWRPGVHHSGQDRHAYLWERGIHDLDALTYLLNARPMRVWGHSFNPPWSPYGGGGGLHAWVEFDNGVTFGLLCTFAAPGRSGSSLRIDCERGTLDQSGSGIVLYRQNIGDPEVITHDDVPHPEQVLLDGFAAYITDGLEPSFSGRRNLTTVALVESIGVASDNGTSIDLTEYLADR